MDCLISQLITLRDIGINTTYCLTSATTDALLIQIYICLFILDIKRYLTNFGVQKKWHTMFVCLSVCVTIDIYSMPNKIDYYLGHN